MNFTRVALVVLSCFSCSITSAQTTVLDHDFENGTSGDLSVSADLGTPMAGTLSATGGFVSVTRPAWTTGNNAPANSITALVDGSFNDVGPMDGNVLTATLSEPAAVGGELLAGETTTVSFSFASFGNSNQTGFKYTHITGLSSTGEEVFQLLWRAGSGAGSRQVYARELGQDNTTFVGSTVVDPETGEETTVGGFSSVDGTLVLSNVSFGINGTNTEIAPVGQIAVSVTFDGSGWGVAAAPTGGTSTETPATGLGIASGATDLASIVFSTSQNSIVNDQNNGVWVDNLLVQTDRTVESTDMTVLKGDADMNGVVDFGDIPAFIAVLQSGEFQAQSDADCNKSVEFADIPAFISILQNP